jgi:hypothetical protein
MLGVVTAPVTVPARLRAGGRRLTGHDPLTDMLGRHARAQRGGPRRCSSSASGARLAIWVERGSKVVADGSGGVKRGVAKIKLAGTLKRGTYRLVEVIDVAGQAGTATHTLKVK